MAASVHFRNLLLTLILGFLLFATQVKSYLDPRVAGVEERSDDRTALPVPETGLPGDGEGKKSLTKREGDLVAIWNALPETRKALIRRMMHWDLPGSGLSHYGASFCYGCIVIVVSSGQRLTIAHLAEINGKTQNFVDEDAFLGNILEPYDEFLQDNLEKLGNRPQAMIFSPTSVGADKVTKLVETIRDRFPAISQDGVVRATYIKTNAFSESNQNVRGKVIVSWSAPVSGTGRAELLFHAEENLKVRVVYDCKDRICLFAIPV